MGRVRMGGGKTGPQVMDLRCKIRGRRAESGNATGSETTGSEE